MIRKVLAILAFAAAAAASAYTVGAGSIEAADHKCAPGQHGNPHPGFKPGVC